MAIGQEVRILPKSEYSREKKIYITCFGVLVAFLIVIFIWELVEHHSIDRAILHQTTVVEHNQVQLAKLETLVEKLEGVINTIETQQLSEEKELSELKTANTVEKDKLSALEKANADEKAALQRIESAVKNPSVPAPGK